ncbi:MAG: histidine phosphatase family protein [Gammaproteobacteria bacterium]
MKDTVVDFLRHGEPEGTSTYRGNGVDDPLSERGLSQMWGAVGNHCPWNVIFTSPLSRCRAFAEAVAQKHSIPVRVDSRLKEVGFGTWEGRERTEIQKNNAGEYEAFYRDPVNCRPAGAEPLADFEDRVSSAFENMLETFPGQRILVVTHAGVIRAAMMSVSQKSAVEAYGIKVSNASFTRFRHTGSATKLEFHNHSVLCSSG